MRWTAALRTTGAALLVAAASLTGGLAAATLWPVPVETAYYAADVSLDPTWEGHSRIHADTVVGNVSAEFTGLAPGIRVEPRIKPEITDLVNSGDLGLDTLAVGEADRERIIGEAATGLALRFAGGAVVGLGVVGLGAALYRRGRPG